MSEGINEITKEVFTIQTTIPKLYHGLTVGNGLSYSIHFLSNQINFTNILSPRNMRKLARRHYNAALKIFKLKSNESTMRHLYEIMTGSVYFIPKTYFFSHKDLFST